MFEKIISLVAWLLLVFIMYATLSPLSSRPSLVVTETATWVAIERFGAYGLLGLLFGLAYARKLTLVVLVVVDSAIGLELLQLFIADRDARFIDVVEKLTGGIAGIGAAQVRQALSRRHGWIDPK
jgi:VanZ family protein